MTTRIQKKIFVKESQRNTHSQKGAFWTYYGSNQDSVELFSASCLNCRDSVIIEPKDSVELILAIENSDMEQAFETIGASGTLEDKTEMLIDSITMLRYFDRRRELMFSSNIVFNVE